MYGSQEGVSLGSGMKTRPAWSAEYHPRNWMLARVLLVALCSSCLGCGLSASLLYEKGKAELKSKDFRQAVRHLELAVEKDPTNRVYQDALARARDTAHGHHIKEADEVRGKDLAREFYSLTAALLFKPNDQATKKRSSRLRAVIAERKNNEVQGRFRDQEGLEACCLERNTPFLC